MVRIIACAIQLDYVKNVSKRFPKEITKLLNVSAAYRIAKQADYDYHLDICVTFSLLRGTKQCEIFYSYSTILKLNRQHLC